MQVRVDGQLPFGVTAKDIILAIIGKIGTAGGTGHVMEFAGSAIRALSMEGRMTICNMAIEGGARVGLMAWTKRPSTISKVTPVRAQGRRLGQGRRPLEDPGVRRRCAFRYAWSS